MRYFHTTGAAWLALSTLTFSAPLPFAGSHLSTVTSSLLRRPQIDYTQERREAQLVVPEVFPPSRPSFHDTTPERSQVIQELEEIWREDELPLDIRLPEHADTFLPTSHTFARTKRHSLDHSTTQLNHNGELRQDHGEEDGQKKSSGDGIDGAKASSETVDEEASKSSTSSAESISPNGGHAKRHEALPPASGPSKLGPDGKPPKDQKDATGEGIKATAPPTETVNQEIKKIGDVHGGCSEKNLASIIKRENGERASNEAGVHWGCGKNKDKKEEKRGEVNID